MSPAAAGTPAGTPLPARPAVRGPAFAPPAALLAALLAAACGDDETPTAPPPPPPPVATTVTVTPSEVLLESLGETVRLTAEVKDQNGAAMANAAVAWSSSAAVVATVDDAGLVTAIGGGSATITAASGSASGTASVRVVDPAGDRAVLETLYNRTGGADWTNSDNWMTDAPLAEWHGVGTSGGRVSVLNLRSNRLSGPIPPELGDLAGLERLYLDGNGLTGPVPPELAKPAGLRALVLSRNALEGEVPPELGGLAALDTLFLTSNRLTGGIPPQLGGLAALKALSLAGNRLSGTVPPELFGLASLERLYLTSNQLEGPLPAEFATMGALEWLRLEANRFSGPIPPEWGSFPSLEYLGLTSNAITGSIPPELGNLGTLERLEIGWNQLTGPIPPEIGGMESLEVLWLYRNKITGPLPAELGNLASIRHMAMSDNEIDGALPPEIGKLATLERINISRNQLSGSIPPELGGMPALKHLDIASNQFSGWLPSEIGDMETIETLRIADNGALVGLLPRSLMQLSTLAHLYYHDTGLCAQIDEPFREWHDAMPETSRTYCEPEMVERYALMRLHDRTGGESWTGRGGWMGDGPVGEWAGVTATEGRVRRIELPGNGLRGPLPAEIGNLAELEALDLTGNDLAGEVPTALASSSLLEELRLADNSRLAGTLPYDLTRLERLETLQYSGTALCASPSAAFQSWLAGIDETSGAQCGNLDAVELAVPVAYLTQSVQGPDRGVRLVANRQALLRVFVTSAEAGAFYEPKVRATFMRGGRETYSVTIERRGDEIATEPYEGDLGLSHNAVIPAEHIVPGTELVVEADPDEMVPRAPGSVVRFPATGSLPLDVVEVPPMELTIVPVVERESPDSSLFEWTDGITGDSDQVAFFRNAFPFSEFTARTHEAHVTDLNVTTSAGQWGVVLEMEMLRASDGATGYYYAAAASVNGYVRGVARLGGWTSMGKPLDLEVAHEVGHNLALYHAPCGGAENSPQFLDHDYPHAGGGLGVWGYDFRDGSVVSPHNHRDIMGYCYSRAWISDYFYEKVIDYREKLRSSAAGARTDALVLWGGEVDGELRIEPAFQMRAAPLLPEGPGPYRLDGIGAGGAREFSLSFTPGRDKFGNLYFFFLLPVEPGWEASLERIVLTGPERSVALHAGERRPISVLTDRTTGRIRAILRDWDGEVPSALRGTDVRIDTTDGLADAVRLRR